MSLLDEAMEQYMIINQIKAPDGYGGTTDAWADGPVIKGAMVFNTSQEARTGQALGVTSLYTFTTAKNINLQYHNVIKRLSDGKIFRVTSDGDDKFTPASANLNMRQVTCEEWELTND